MDVTAYKGRLQHVYWIGGTSCSAKTTCARLVAQKHGFQVYHCADHMREYYRRAHPAKHPALSNVGTVPKRWQQLNMLPASTLFEMFQHEATEAFDMVIEDILQLPQDHPIMKAPMVMSVWPFITLPVSSTGQLIIYGLKSYNMNETRIWRFGLSVLQFQLPFV